MPEPLSYASLGVRSVINAAATLTALGGSVIPDEVVDAMRMAASSHVNMHELQAAVGTELARLTHNEAGYVSAGAAAGLTLSVLACATKGDPAAISQMPGGHGLPTEVVMHCGHRIPYDRAVELAGGRIVQIGNAIQTFGWELEAVLGANTAMVLWVAGSHLSAGTLDLAETVRIAHARGIPVVVDAAAQLPPVENLWAFTQAGADLALFSGGKALRGPQATGLVLGRATLIEAIRANGAPHQRLARAMKVGKEEMLGLLAAVRRYLAIDHPAQQSAWEVTVARWSAELNRLPGVTAARAYPNEAGQPSPRLHVGVDAARAGVTGADVVRQLWQRDPRIAVGADGEHGFFITPDTLAPGEDHVVLDAIRDQFGCTGRPMRKPAR